MATTSLAPSYSTTRALGTAARPTLLFVVAYALNVTPHEAVHALVSYRLGLSSTLHQMWVDPDAAFASPGQLAALAAAGPIFSLAVGVSSWMLYRKLKSRASGLFFLMMAIVSVYSFFGPMAGAAFGGDFYNALRFMNATRPIQLVMSVAGVLMLAIFMFFMGPELSSWAPAGFGRVKNVLCTSVAPWLVGPFLILLIYWPLPKFLVASTFTGSVFWAVAVVGAIFGSGKPRGSRPIPSVTKFDIAAAIVAITMVRVLAHGIRLAR